MSWMFGIETAPGVTVRGRAIALPRIGCTARRACRPGRFPRNRSAASVRRHRRGDDRVPGQRTDLPVQVASGHDAPQAARVVGTSAGMVRP
jgi:hypothetical protein